MEPNSVSLDVALLAGIASFLSPCVLPLVPSYLAVLAGLGLQGWERKGRAELRRAGALHAVFFVLGFSALFVGLGARATPVGPWLRAALSPVQQGGGVLLALLGVYLLVVGRRFAAGHGGLSPRVIARGGPALSAAVGAVFAAAWTPCIGPVLASALLYASLPDTVTRGVPLLIAFSLGLGIPFVVTGVAVFALLTLAPRPWLSTLRGVAGAVVIGVGVLLVTGHFAALTAALARFSPLIEVG